MTKGVMDLRVQELPPRRVVVRSHQGSLDQLDETRRPLYQHLIMQEAVGGPSMLRFHGIPDQDPVDVLVAAAPGFAGDDEHVVEELPGGNYLTAYFEGPESTLNIARHMMLTLAEQEGYRVDGPLIQVHLMDPIEGVTEQEFQIRLAE